MQSNAERVPFAVPRHSGRATKNPQNSQTVGRNTALPLLGTQKRTAWLASKKQSSLSAVLQHRYCCTFMYWSQPHQSKSKGPGVLSDSLLPSSLDHKPAHNTGNTAAQTQQSCGPTSPVHVAGCREQLTRQVRSPPTNCMARLRHSQLVQLHQHNCTSSQTDISQDA